LPPCIRIQVLQLSLDFVELPEVLQRLLGDLALVVDVEVEEFPPGVRVIWFAG
jgi:hypothetical protein